MNEITNNIYNELYKIHYHKEDGLEPLVNLNEAIKIIDKILSNQVQAVVKPDACGHWQTEKPIKPCLFVARYNAKDPHPSLVYAGYDEGILCVADTEENFISTMGEYADCEYFIIEYI